MFKKCKVVMLPTNKKAEYKQIVKLYPKQKNLYLGITRCKEFESQGKNCIWVDGEFCSSEGTLYSNGDFIPQHLYILSDDRIQVYDSFINIEYINTEYQDQMPFVCKNKEHEDSLEYTNLTKKQWYKIIATTDTELNLPAPSKSFIEKYCELGEINEVMVEYRDFVEEWSDISGAYETGGDLKVKDNIITIKKVKDTWTREETINFGLDLLNNIIKDRFYTKKDLSDIINKLI